MNLVSPRIQSLILLDLLIVNSRIKILSFFLLLTWEKDLQLKFPLSIDTLEIQDNKLPDRFNNGDVSNDSGAPKGSISHGGLDTTSKWAFHGGDMAGIEQKLDYLKSMGITAIWMTPILRNKAVQKGGFAHHGYWIVDFTEIDPHFGSNADLKRLIDTAHKKDIKVFFDIITRYGNKIYPFFLVKVRSVY